MKIGALDVNWYNLPIEKRLKRIAELGFQGIEFWYTLRELGFSESVIITEWPLDHVVKREYFTPKKFAKLVEEYGVEAHSFGQFNIMGPQPFPVGPTKVVTGEERVERIKEIKGLMDFASEAGVKILICDSGGDPDKPEQWPIFIDEFMRELVDYAEKVGVILAMENTPQNLVANDNDLFRLMREIPSKSLRVHYDPANNNLVWPDRVVEAIYKLKDYIVSLHAKDSIPGKGPYGQTEPGIWICPPIGKGTVPWKNVLRALKDIGYNGYLIVEYMAPGRKTEEDIETAMIHGKHYLEKLLAEL